MGRKYGLKPGRQRVRVAEALEARFWSSEAPYSPRTPAAAAAARSGRSSALLRVLGAKIHSVHLRVTGLSSQANPPASGSLQI